MKKILLFFLIGMVIGAAAVEPPLLRGPLTTNNAAVQTRIFRAALTNFYVTPEMFGAVGDGTGRDARPLQAWLNYAQTNKCIAILPPRIYGTTNDLFITNINGLTIEGYAGDAHVSSSINQGATILRIGAGNGIIITNCPPSFAAPSDAIRIRDIMVKCDTFSTSTHGIWFNGSTTSSDCDEISHCQVSGFGRGIQNESASDITIRGCSIGFNAYGLWLGRDIGNTNGMVANNTALYGCQLSYNYTNQLFQRAGSVVFHNMDIAPVAPLANAIYITNSGVCTLYNVNVETYGTNIPAIILTTTVEGGINFRATSSAISNPNANAESYAIKSTNAAVYLDKMAIPAVAADGYSIWVHNDLGSPTISANQSWPFKFTGAGGIILNMVTANTGITMYQSGTVAPQDAQLVWYTHGQATDDDGASIGGDIYTSKFLVGARFGAWPTIGSSVQTVNLLDFYTAQRVRLGMKNGAVTNAFRFLNAVGGTRPTLQTLETFLWNSNGVLYAVSNSKTNVVSDLR